MQIKKYTAILTLVGLAVLGAWGDVWKDLAKYKYGEGDAAEEAHHLLQQTPVEQHGAIEDALLKVVAAADATPDGKALACRMLQQVATEKSIPAVAALLPDEVLSHYARLVLQRLGNPRADAALRAALDKAPDKVKLGIIGSLGERRDVQAVPPLTKLARQPDPAIAAAAIVALGKIGGAEAARSLGELQAGDSLSSARWEALIRCAASLPAAEAAALYEKALARGQRTHQLAALGGLLRVNTDQAAPRLTTILKGNDLGLQRGALTLVAEGAGAAPVTKTLTDLLGSLPEAKKAGLLTALGARGDKAALAAVTAYAANANTGIREAALLALSKLGDAGTVKVLLASTDPKAADALARMPGDEVNDVLIRCLADSQLQGAALKALAARAGSAAVPQLLKLVNDPDAGVRKAVWSGLGSLATEEDMAAVAAAAFAIKDAKETAAALAVLKSICLQARDKGRCFDFVAANYDQASPAAKASIVDLAAAAGSPAALEVERKALKSGDKELYGKAVRALAAWGNATAAGDLLELARNAPADVDRLLALRGYIQLAGTEKFKLHPGERMELFKKAGALAKRADEKKMIISGLMLAGSADALNMTGAYWDDSAVRAEAELTADQLMDELKQKNPAEVKALAGKLQASKNAALANKARKILAEIK
ncbi:MAG: HEAT repeat domain-containing protein [Kiritimatiellaeota bacterium]|nr:HEAT repeat domain-containing protein [Kiritimatiellota bacterium]